MRKCGDCQLCCKLTPVVEQRGRRSFLKLANHKCPFSSYSKGCTIYNDVTRRPVACFIWRCRWLKGEEGTENLPRPDRAGYVIDEAPDMVMLKNEETGEEKRYPAIQIWIGNRKDFTADKALQTYMNMMADKGFAFVFRLNEKEALTYMRLHGYWQYSFSSATIEQAPDEIASVWKEHGLA